MHLSHIPLNYLVSDDRVVIRNAREADCRSFSTDLRRQPQVFGWSQAFLDFELAPRQSHANSATGRQLKL